MVEPFVALVVYPTRKDAQAAPGRQSGAHRLREDPFPPGLPARARVPLGGRREPRDAHRVERSRVFPAVPAERVRAGRDPARRGAPPARRTGCASTPRSTHRRTHLFSITQRERNKDAEKDDGRRSDCRGHDAVRGVRRGADRDREAGGRPGQGRAEIDKADRRHAQGRSRRQGRHPRQDHGARQHAGGGVLADLQAVRHRGASAQRRARGHHQGPGRASTPSTTPRRRGCSTGRWPSRRSAWRSPRSTRTRC